MQQFKTCVAVGSTQT